ncbi:MAG: dethiobiotin synthase [Desulfobulbaceae bacterium]|nr:dethiobiotin synthase [Desulfobulbaceae bacterium]HIJ78621.1 dethiobiotin synthase [Deltaproteobacteria bacterium]
MKQIFVTGTDTDVGKTFVCGLLLNFFKEQGVDVGYQKWAATGPDFPPADLVSCLNAAGLPLVEADIPLQVPYHFALPASPHLAAEQQGAEVDPGHIRRCYQQLKARHQLLVVEGVGGLLVPLRRDLLLAELLAELMIPTLIVARSGLGTINHTLLTLEGLRARQIPVLGVLFSDAASGDNEILVADNMATIGEIGQVKILGRLPRCRELAQAREAFSPIGRAISREIGLDRE